MQNTNHDTEEYKPGYCSAAENGFDVPEWDDFEYQDLAERVGMDIVEVKRG